MSLITIHATLTKGETVEKYLDKFIKENDMRNNFDVWITKEVNGEMKKYNYIVWQRNYYKCKRIKRR